MRALTVAHSINAKCEHTHRHGHRNRHRHRLTTLSHTRARACYQTQTQTLTRTHTQTQTQTRTQAMCGALGACPSAHAAHGEYENRPAHNIMRGWHRAERPKDAMHMQ